MSRRRRRVREAGPVRKGVEVVVSALFGMGVVGVVLLMLQGGASPGTAGPQPGAPAGQGEVAGSSAGLDGGLGIHSAAPGTPSPDASTVYSAVPAPDPATADARRPSAAQAGGTDEPAGPPSPGTKNSPTSAPGGGSGATPTSGPSPSSSADPGLLGGLVGGVGGLVGGVLGLV